MNCGNCNRTDGVVYTSYPPQVKCSLTGNFHHYGDQCEIEDAKENLVLVTRCGRCEFYDNENNKCAWLKLNFSPKDYCSYGRRKKDV